MAAILDLVTETIECGPLYGDASILQLAAPAFNHVCSSGEEQGRAVDSTGLRIHAGLHVTARLLLAYPSLLAGKRVVELGCGTGALGLVTTRAGALTAALALTDGSELSVQVAERNVAAFGAGARGVSVHLLPWGASPHVAEVLRSSSHKSVFDVAIGCELLYYSTDVEALVDTVMQLTDARGVFVHGHIFRRRGIDAELIAALARHGWRSLRVPLAGFVEAVELGQHPEWYKVHVLVSARAEMIEAVMGRPGGSGEERDDLVAALAAAAAAAGAAGRGRRWREFTGIDDAQREDDEDDDEEEEEEEDQQRHHGPELPARLAQLLRDRDAIRESLEATEGANAVDWDLPFDASKLSPLHAAVAAGDVTRVQALLAAGADIEERQDDIGDYVECTPLFHAAAKGHAAVAQCLVERGADKEATDEDGWAPLHAAAGAGHVDVVRMLITHGADKDAVNDGHTTPLLRACAGGHVDVAKCLLELGCDRDAVSKGNWTSLLWAVNNGHVAVTEYLLEEGFDVDHADDMHGYTALHLAAIYGHLEVAHVLLRFGATLDVQSDEGETAADLAIQHDYPEVAAAIRAEEIRRRDHGFKRDRSTIPGTEEHAASQLTRAEREAEEAAAAAAAAVDSSDDDDDEDEDEDDDEDEKGPDTFDEEDEDNSMSQLSSLHAAVKAGDVARVEALVVAGANIEERHMNETPLYRAAEMGCVAVARYLVERGADKEATAGNGWTSLIIATYYGHVEVVRMLIEHGANKDAANVGGDTSLIWASYYGHVAVVECLLEQGCDVDRATKGGNTALHFAARHNRLEIAQLLLRFGAKLDLRNNYGQTPADLATQYGHHDIANAIRAEEIRRRDHGFKRDRSTIEGTEEHAASKRPRAEREAEEEAAAAAAADESDDDDDDEDDDDEEES